MKKILSYIFICIILFNFLLYPVQGTIYSPIFEVFKYEEYEKKWSDEIDTYIQENRNIFIATIMDAERNYDEVSDKVTYDYDIKVHAYWWKKQTKTTKLLTFQNAGTEFWWFHINSFDKNKTYIFFNKSDYSSIGKDNNIKLKEIGQGNSIKYLSKLGYPDHVYSSEESHMLVDLKTFQETRNQSLGNYEGKNFIYNRNNITQIKNTDKLIKLWGNIFQYEDKILFQKGNKYQLFMIKWNDFQFKELWDYYLMQNNKMIYGISKWNQKQTISLIYNLWNFKEMKHKFWNFYEDNSRVYFVNEISDKQRNVYTKLLKEDWDFNILDSLYIEVDYTVTFDSISKELFDKVHSVYGQKIKKLSYEKKLWLLEKIREIKNPYYKKRHSKNPKFVKKYKETEFILNYLISNLQIETKNREIKIQSQNDIKHLMWNVFEYEGEILIKKWDKYLYYYKKADDFKIKMVNGYVLIYNNSELYSISQTSAKPTVLKIDYWYIVSGFDLDEFVHVEWKLYKDDTYYYIPNIIDALDTHVAKFWYDIWWINQKDNIQYDYNIRLYGEKKSHMSSLLGLKNAEYTDMTEEEIRENIESIQLKRKYFGTNVYMLFHDYFKIEGLEKQLKRLQDEK